MRVLRNSRPRYLKLLRFPYHGRNDVRVSIFRSQVYLNSFDCRITVTSIEWSRLLRCLDVDWYALLIRDLRGPSHVHATGPGSLALGKSTDPQQS